MGCLATFARYGAIRAHPHIPCPAPALRVCHRQAPAGWRTAGAARHPGGSRVTRIPPSFHRITSRGLWLPLRPPARAAPFSPSPPGRPALSPSHDLKNHLATSLQLLARHLKLLRALKNLSLYPVIHKENFFPPLNPLPYKNNAGTNPFAASNISHPRILASSQ